MDEETPEVLKPDFKLSDGTEIFFDLSKMTYGQWLGFFSPKESDESPNVTLARVAGITEKKLKKLNLIEYKRLFAAMVNKSKEPLSDPNA